VDISLKGYEANRVSVIGAVAKPGVYPLKRSGQLLTDMLSEAGGKSQTTGNRIILLPDPSHSVQSGKLAATKVSMKSGDNDSSIDAGSGVEIEMDDLIGGINRRPILVPLMPGDTIVVPEVGKFEVDGEVSKPGSYPLASRTSAIGAVAAAGGFTYSADANKVEVIRDIGDGKKALVTLDLEEVGLRAGKDVPLRDGDLVRIPSEPGRFFRRQIVESLNSLFNGVGVSAKN
jgi:polysaccharide export outer membrane protein